MIHFHCILGFDSIQETCPNPLGISNLTENRSDITFLNFEPFYIFGRKWRHEFNRAMQKATRKWSCIEGWFARFDFHHGFRWNCFRFTPLRWGTCDIRRPTLWLQMHWHYINVLVQERCNSIVNALELRLSCTKIEKGCMPGIQQTSQCRVECHINNVTQQSW